MADKMDINFEHDTPLTPITKGMSDVIVWKLDASTSFSKKSNFIISIDEYLKMRMNTKQLKNIQITKKIMLQYDMFNTKLCLAYMNMKRVNKILRLNTTSLFFLLKVKYSCILIDSIKI